METPTHNLAQQVAEQILSMITIDKTLKPGDKLPNELDFSASLGVSRTTLREAIRIQSPDFLSVTACLSL